MRVANAVVNLGAVPDDAASVTNPSTDQPPGTPNSHFYVYSLDQLGLA